MDIENRFHVHMIANKIAILFSMLVMIGTFVVLFSRTTITNLNEQYLWIIMSNIFAYLTLITSTLSIIVIADYNHNIVKYSNISIHRIARASLLSFSITGVCLMIAILTCFKYN